MQSNIFMQWTRWRFFLLARFLEKIFSFSGKARGEAAQYEKGLPRIGRTAFEDARAAQFYEFYNSIDGNQFSSLNAITLFLLISGVFIAALPFLPFQAQVAAWATYLGWLALAVCVIALLRVAFSKPMMEGAVTQEEYERDKEFLYHMGEESKQQPPLFITIALWAMLLVDAAMVCVVVMDYASDLPRKYALYGGLATGLVVAFVLDFLNSRAGASLYREHHRCRLARTITAEGGLRKSETALAIKSVSKHFDVSEESFTRRYGYLVLSVIVMMIIAGLAFEARYSLNINVIQQEVSYSVANQIEDTTLPPSVASRQQANANEIAKKEGENAQTAMMASLIILSVIFLAIQFVVGATGYKYAFYNDASEKAYLRVRRYEAAAALRAIDGEVRSAGQELVCMRANSFLAAYYNALVKKAHARVGTELLDDLEDREGPLKFEDFVHERQIAQPKSVRKPRVRVVEAEEDDEAEVEEKPVRKARTRTVTVEEEPVEEKQAAPARKRAKAAVADEADAEDVVMEAKPKRTRAAKADDGESAATKTTRSSRSKADA